MKNKVGKIIVIIVIVIALMIGVFFLVKQLIWDYKVAHAEKIVELGRTEIEVYEKNVRLNSLIKEINGSLTTNPKVNTDKLGKQTISFKYTTDEGYPVKHEVEVEVVDTTPPFIFQSSGKTINTGYDSDLAKDLFCGDNYDPNPKCTIEGDYDVNTPGQYALTFVGEDSSGNISKSNFTLTVRKPSSSSGGGGTYYYTDFDEIKENYQGENLKYGIDISHWQGDINFKKVKEAGVEFVYIRVGRGNGIGEDYILDDKFEQNIKGFNEVGIPVGVYFYSYANSAKDAEKEAKWVLDKIKGYQVDLEIVFDWENWGSFQYYDFSFHGIQEAYYAFQKTVVKAGYKAMLYSSKSYLETVWDRIEGSWLAHYTSQTSYTGDYVVWQLCDDGRVDGIDGYVDLDIRYK